MVIISSKNMSFEEFINVAINKDNVEYIKEIKTIETTEENYEEETKQNKNLPRIGIISMGGTISSKVDYTSGGVSAQFTASDLIKSIPELKTRAYIETYAFSNILSENINEQHWLGVLNKIKEFTEKGVEGIIIAHGTDTMHYSSAMLSFLLEEIGIPILLMEKLKSLQSLSNLK